MQGNGTAIIVPYVNASAVIANTSVAPDFMPQEVFQDLVFGIGTDPTISLTLPLGLVSTFNLIRLYFAELLPVTAGQRLMDIFIQGQVRLLV